MQKSGYKGGKKQTNWDNLNGEKWLMCSRKRPYPSLRIAERKAADLAEKTGSFWRAYKCNSCKNYHLTTKLA